MRLHFCCFNVIQLFKKRFILKYKTGNDSIFLSNLRQLQIRQNPGIFHSLYTVGLPDQLFQSLRETVLALLVVYLSCVFSPYRVVNRSSWRIESDPVMMFRAHLKRRIRGCLRSPGRSRTSCSGMSRKRVSFCERRVSERGRINLEVCFQH